MLVSERHFFCKILGQISEIKRRYNASYLRRWPLVFLKFLRRGINFNNICVRIVCDPPHILPFPWGSYDIITLNEIIICLILILLVFKVLIFLYGI